MSAAEAAAYSNNNTGTLPTLNMFSKFQVFTNQVTSQVTPFAARSQQWIKEQTGTVGEKTELPHDYLELEVRVDALKTTHQKLPQPRNTPTRRTTIRRTSRRASRTWARVSARR
jgi:hypothetical protein